MHIDRNVFWNDFSLIDVKIEVSQHELSFFWVDTEKCLLFGPFLMCQAHGFWATIAIDGIWADSLGRSETDRRHTLREAKMSPLPASVCSVCR